MGLVLHIPACKQDPVHGLHFPSPDRPLRVQIEGPLTSIEKLVPHATWSLEHRTIKFPQTAGPELARIAFKTIYGRGAQSDVPGDLVVRDEYLGWMPEKRPKCEIDYYGVTFDHLVSPDDLDPEVLQINITEMDYDGGEYARQVLPFAVDPADYTGKKVLAVPRCCQKRRGTTDRGRVNSSVMIRLGMNPYGLSLPESEAGEQEPE